MTPTALNTQTGWTPRQRNHLRRLVKEGTPIAYVCTDQHGRPANGGPATRQWQLRPGLVQTVPGPLVLCGPGALHGTLEPHRWKGCRVWVAGFIGPAQPQGDKIGALCREIIGEVLPECAMSPSVGVRIGRKDLAGANLQGADLRRADLRGADLRGADLRGASLRGADLQGASLRWADLYGADLQGADLHGARLYGANLQGANLQGADLQWADLREASLRGANLRGANLTGAILPAGFVRSAGTAAT